MLKPILAAAMFAASLAAAPVTAAAQDEGPTLALNEVRTAPTTRNSWRLTLSFGRSDRSPTASARSVRAPNLAPYELMITDADGKAAPFIIHEVSAPTGNEITVQIEYFGAAPFSDGDVYTVHVLDTEHVDAERATASFDFLPPSLGESAG